MPRSYMERRATPAAVAGNERRAQERPTSSRNVQSAQRCASRAWRIRKSICRAKREAAIKLGRPAQTPQRSARARCAADCDCRVPKGASSNKHRGSAGKSGKGPSGTRPRVCGKPQKNVGVPPWEAEFDDARTKGCCRRPGESPYAGPHYPCKGFRCAYWPLFITRRH